ncbi:MAG: helix-turn-helix domain-containing protein, partial [Myxococcota bacterium]
LLDVEVQHEAPGSHTVIRRLVDALLVYALRHHIERASPTQLGWLNALRDPALSRALSLMHKEYAKPWTLESLARASGTSRASLARHFVAEVGSTPIQYLTARRLHAARRLMVHTTLSLDEVADEVGYASAFSLSKAFKRHFGAAPTHLSGRRAMRS